MNSMDVSDGSSFRSKWICNVRKILNLSGFSNIWLAQGNHNSKWLKLSLEQRIKDMNQQEWLSDVNSNSLCYNYKIFKENVTMENYLTRFAYNERITMARFRCGNVLIPSNKGRFGLNDNEKICNLCTKGLLGDEFHYLFICDHFSVERSTLLKKYYYKRPNSRKMSELFNHRNCKLASNLCKLMSLILRRFKDDGSNP